MIRRARIHHIAVQIDDRGSNILASRVEFDNSIARNRCRHGVSLRDWRQGEEVLDRIVEANKIANRVDPTHDFLAEEAWGNTCCATEKYRELVGIDGEVVYAGNRLQIAVLVAVLVVVVAAFR